MVLLSIPFMLILTLEKSFCDPLTVKKAGERTSSRPLCKKGNERMRLLSHIPWRYASGLTLLFPSPSRLERNAVASGDPIQDHDRDDARRAMLVLSEVGHDGRVRVEQTVALASFHD